MSAAVPMVEIQRGGMLESLHQGHAVVANARGEIIASWGDPDVMIYPRSSCKMIQALPLLTSGAADRYGLSPEHLALACASHNGAAIHTDRVTAWLDRLGLDDSALRCGPQDPADIEARDALICGGAQPVQTHNNCSGKHSGFLTLSQYMGAGPEYIEIDHPVQQAVLAAFEETTDETSPGFGIDGCSAPNFACSLKGLARSMAWFAGAPGKSGLAEKSAARLVDAMMAHPELVAGEGRACTALMRAMGGRGAVKTGAEAVYVAILPDLALGVALKIVDGATRASECAIAAILVGLGVLDRDDAVVRTLLDAPMYNRAGVPAAEIRAADALRKPIRL